MSGGEPSSIKRDVSCAARAPVPQLRAEDLFIACLFYYISRRFSTKIFCRFEKIILYNGKIYGIITKVVLRSTWKAAGQIKYGLVAQLGERCVRIAEVEGSIPFESTMIS